jgi:Ca2+-binding EF-hand superfamily protein
MVSLQSYFQQIDTDGSGALDLDEFMAAVLELKLEVS